MKLIDKILRRWRVSVALKAIPCEMKGVFDIGCDDGYLLSRLDNDIMKLDGCDPRLTITSFSSRFMILKGYFPDVLEANQHRGPYDAIFALAVFEHFSEKDLIEASNRIPEMLSDRGRLIVTVPHPFVDTILDVLLFLKLIEGQALDEHHGLDPLSLIAILSKNLTLKSKKTFQFGLNNLFVFEKI